MLRITSRDNPRLKFARKVSSGSIKDTIFVEGVRLAEEILRSKLTIFDVFFTDDFRHTERGRKFLSDAAGQTDNFAEVSESILNSLADTKKSQGIIVIASKPETRNILTVTDFRTDKNQLPVFILLHRINNPTNLGAILRTAEAVNVAGVILSENSADVFSPKALRGAMGASFRLAVQTNADFFEVLSWAKENELVSVCADVNAEKSYLDIDWTIPHLLVFGSEAHGLSAEERGKINEGLVIPMENNVESLNLAVSCGVILFEARRQFSNA